MSKREVRILSGRDLGIYDLETSETLGMPPATTNWLDANRARLVGRIAPVKAKTPSIVLANPKYPHNVGMVYRLCASYGIEQLWYTGDRIASNLGNHKRLPREERLRAYQDETILINNDYPFSHFGDAIPIAFEVRPNSEWIYGFEHPENAVYVFGPEDGSIAKGLLNHCHRFVIIPTMHCLNLATAVATVLHDRNLKLWRDGKLVGTTPGEHEDRGYQT